MRQPVGFAAAPFEKFDERIADKTECEPVGNRIRKGDSNQREKGWNRFREIFPVDLREVLKHYGANDDERGRGNERVTADHSDERAKKQRTKE